MVGWIALSRILLTECLQLCPLTANIYEPHQVNHFITIFITNHYFQLHALYVASVDDIVPIISMMYSPVGTHKWPVHLRVRVLMCVVAKCVWKWTACPSPISKYLHIKQRYFLSSMTKTAHRWGWLSSLHHGYQTDRDLVKLNTNHPGGKRKEEGLFHAALKDIFTTVEQTPITLWTRPVVSHYLPGTAEPYLGLADQGCVLSRRRWTSW